MRTSTPSVFLSYVPEDEESLRALEAHLYPLHNAGKIALWSARAMHPGEDAARTKEERLAAADVVLLLLSADYLASETASGEMGAAVRKRHAEGATIVPVLVRPCLVEETPLGRFRPLPENGEPVSTWKNGDLAWLSVAKAVRDLVTARLGGRPSALMSPPLPRVPHFLGRDAQADELVKALVAAPPQPVLLQGGPGIGKTTLSIAVVHRSEIAEQFGPRRVFARLDGATTGDALLATVATAAGLALSPNLRAGLHAWLLEAPVLVVLDNLETPYSADREGTEAAIAWLTEMADVAVLGSVRGTVRPSGARWRPIELRSLQAPHDVDLFCKLAEEHAGERAAVAELVGALGGVPLAIVLLAHAAQGNPLSNLRAEWEARRSAVLDRGGGDKHASWAACVELSFQSSRMTAEAERLCGVLALLPEGAAIEDLPQLLAGQAVVPAAARVLAQVGVAHFENGRLRMLPPVRDHVCTARPAEAADRVRAMELYRSLADTMGPQVGALGGREAIERLAPEWANLEQMLEAGLATGEPGVWIDAAAGLCNFVRISGLGSRAPIEKARVAAQRTGDTARQATCARGLGDIALRRSDHGAARARYEEALLLSREVGDVRGVARCTQGLGNISLERREHDVARARYEEALVLFRKVDDVLGEAHCIQSLGDIALSCSDHDAARARYEEALSLHRRISEVLGEANALLKLGDIALDQADHDAALARYEEALLLFRRAGDILGEANCILGLGDIALSRSDHEAARARYQEALRLYARIPEPYSMGRTERRLARLASTNGMRRRHVAAARRFWTQIERLDLVAELDEEFPF